MSVSSAPWTSVPVHVIDFEGSARTGVVEFGVATLLGGEVVAAATALHAPRAPVPAIDPPTSMVHAIVRRAVAAGVRLVTIDVPAGDTFAFSDTDETVTDASRGFSDTAGLVGGQLVGAIG